MTYFACPFPENLLLFGPLGFTAAGIVLASAFPALRTRAVASVSSAAAAVIFVLQLLYTGFSGQVICGSAVDAVFTASAAIMLVLSCVFPAGEGMQAVFAPFFLSAVFTTGNTAVSAMSLAALMLLKKGASARGLIYFAAAAMLLSLPGKAAYTALYIAIILMSAAPGFAWMEKDAGAEHAVFTGAAAALVLTALTLAAGQYIQPQAVLPVVFALLCMSLFRAVTEDSAAGYVSGAANSFFLLYVFYLIAGVVPGKYAFLFPAAGLAAGYSGLAFARENAGSGNVIDSLRYWKKGAAAKWSGAAFTALWAALELTLLALLCASSKTDQFITALVFFVSAVYGIAVMNRLLILLSAMKHFSAAKRTGRAGAAAIITAVLFSAMSAALMIRSVL